MIVRVRHDGLPHWSECHMVQFKKESSIQRPYFGAEYERTCFTKVTLSISDSAETAYRMTVSGFSLEASRSPLCPTGVM